MVPTYIAAPFSMKETVYELGEFLRPYGFETVHRWLEHELPISLAPGQELRIPTNQEYARLAALEDITDVLRAMVVIVLLEPHDTSKYGWMLELGLALGSENCQEVWLIGEPFSVFHLLRGTTITEDGHVLPVVVHFESIDSLKAICQQLEDSDE